MINRKSEENKTKKEKLYKGNVLTYQRICLGVNPTREKAMKILKEAMEEPVTKYNNDK